MTTPPGSDKPPWALVVVSVLYLATSVLGTWFAVSEGLPGRPFGWESGLSALADFLYGLGTALSAPLVLLVLLTTLIMLVARGGRGARVPARLMAILGLGFFVGMLAEPIALDVWQADRFEILPAVLVIGNLVIPIVIVVLAGRVWKGHP